MISYDLTTSDVLADDSKNLCNIYMKNNIDDDDDNEDTVNLNQNLYYTETEFLNFITTNKFNNLNNLTIISINIANFFSKLGSFKIFISNITSKDNKPDIIVVVETHINENNNAGYSQEEMKNIIPGYDFFHRGRKSKRGGGVGILVSKDIEGEAQICKTTTAKTKFIDEQFENISVRIPGALASSGANDKKDLIIVAVYRQPNSDNLETFLESIENLLLTIDKINI